MYYVIRVRLTAAKEIEECTSGLIQSPDLEMFVVIRAGDKITDYLCMHTTVEGASKACELFEKLAKSEELQKSKKLV